MTIQPLPEGQPNPYGFPRPWVDYGYTTDRIEFKKTVEYEILAELRKIRTILEDQDTRMKPKDKE